VNDLTSTSIPVEMAAKVNEETQIKIVLVSYYTKQGHKFDPDLQEMEIPMICLGADSRTDLQAYRKLRQICINKSVDIIHTHHNSVGSLGRLAVAGTETKVINTEHNDHRYFSHLQKVVNAVTYVLAGIMVHNSYSTHHSLSWYENILSKWSQHKVVYNGIDTTRIDDTGASPVSLPEGPILTTVGRLVEQKNHATLLRAFKKVLEKHPETTLIIVGDGPLSDDLKSITKDLDIENSVRFTGYLPSREHVYSVLERSTIGIFSSWYEGFCVAAVEAMAVGLPVVVSDIEVLREVVGDPGVFADPDDPVAFAEAISDLLQHRKKREKLGREAKNRARSEFSIESTARKYSDLYDEILEKSDKRVA
jgi:glycosyltransferase involved in cell wall biosynthesis